MLSLALLATAVPMKILFLGNSHTTTYNVAGMTVELLRSAGAQVETHAVQGASFLNDFANDTRLLSSMRKGTWNVAVLQAAKLSSSHRYIYSQEGGLKVADAANAGGAKTFFFAEWPRRGWNESNYIYGIYAGMVKDVKAEIIPVCDAWDWMRSNFPHVDLWAADGNHSNLSGAYLAAMTLARHLHGPNFDPTWIVSGLTKAYAKECLRAAEASTRTR